MKIIFMGTPDFAVPSLKILIDNYDVKAVLTQPDKPKGRGKKLTASPIKELALKYDIPVYQPIKLKDDETVKDILKKINPDFIVVVAFGQILTKEILDIPTYGCINLHASLLPKYRGAAPINWAIMNGEKITGNTTMLMNEGLDTGDILLSNNVEIGNKTTAGELHDILMDKGAPLLLETLEKVFKGEIKRIKQGETPTMYASMLNKNMAKIDWNKSATEIEMFIRGLNPWPVAYTSYDGNSMKIYEAEVIKEDNNENVGTILSVDSDGVKVVCGKETLLIKKLQFPGKKSMEVGEYIKGNTIKVKIILGA